MKTYISQIWAEQAGKRKFFDCRRFQAADPEDLRSRIEVEAIKGVTVLVISREAPEPPLVGQGEFKL